MEHQQLGLGLLLLAFAMSLFLFLFRRGRLAYADLLSAPARPAGLQLLDLLVAFAMLLVGGWLAMNVLDLLQLRPTATEPSTDPRQMVYSALITQSFMQLPVAIYILARAANHPGGIQALGLTPPGSTHAPDSAPGSAGGYAPGNNALNEPRTSVSDASPGTTPAPGSAHGNIPTSNPASPAKALAWGLVAFIFALPLVLGINAVVSWLSFLLGHPAPPLGHKMLQALANLHSPGLLTLLLLSAVVLAPLFEEIIYRGLVQTTLLEYLGPANRLLVLMTSAAIFASIHLGSVTWHMLPGLFVLALVLGYLYERTATLWPSLIVHLLFNAANIMLVLLLYPSASAP
ncbi:MAG: CPBP family intramembrane metalloprotease [Phycisphaeraceae bacterium]|nr:CPBP family intramembrane metalloprotease [Phycisphaeraceae bacterium]